MKNNIQNISVLGDGGWGTTLAIHLAKKGYSVTLWGPFEDYIREMLSSRVNAKFLSGIRIPDQVQLSSNLQEVLQKNDLIIFAIPSKYARDVAQKIKNSKVDLDKKIFLSATKGIETTRLLRISQILQQALGKINLAVLSGPNIAREVATGVPSTAVVASQNLKTAKRIQEILNSDMFRIYTNSDITGVELGGSLKNIIAIACGICDGLGFGSNTKAAILTRGLAEMARLGKVLGAKEKTFTGLSGLGDLVTTCFSPQSRNRSVGEKLGQGQAIHSILSSTEMVAEGVETVKAAHKLSSRHKVSMPITTEVYKIIYEKKKPLDGVRDLMTRKKKSE